MQAECTSQSGENCFFVVIMRTRYSLGGGGEEEKSIFRARKKKSSLRDARELLKEG